MKTTKMILLGLVVSALSTLFAADAFSWSHRAYVFPRPVYRQINVGYPVYPSNTVCEYVDDSWVYYGPVYRAIKPFPAQYRYYRHRHW
jgi:hypothetical protein